MSDVWKTKYGPRRVRHDPPTLKEAITAAQGLTGDLQEQAAIAAALMDVSVEDVRAELAKMDKARGSAQIVAATGKAGIARTVIVERKPSRRTSAQAARPAVAAKLGNGSVEPRNPKELPFSPGRPKD